MTCIFKYCYYHGNSKETPSRKKNEANYRYLLSEPFHLKRHILFLKITLHVRPLDIVSNDAENQIRTILWNINSCRRISRHSCK